MSLTYGGIGTVATGNNASLNPTLPAGATDGDLLLLFAVIRNSGTGSPDTPAGWTPMLDMGNAKVFGKIMEASTTAPTVTFTGGVANADTQAAITKWGGHPPNVLTASETVAVQSNASAQNIAYPAFSPFFNGRAAILVAWKQDDSTAVTPPAGFTGIINSSVTAGDDATLRVMYQIQTTATDVPAGSLTVTGGAAAISKAAWLILEPAITFDVTMQDAVYPPRAVLTASGLQGDELLEIYRVVAGERTLIRGGEIQVDGDPAVVRIDAEIPFGVPVYWVAQVNLGTEYTTATQTVELTGGKVAFTDAVTGLAAEAVIMSWPDKTRERRTSVFQLANGKTRVVSGPPAQFASRIDVFTEADVTRRLLQELLDAATSNVIQIRQAGSYHDVDCYVSVLTYTVRRYSQDGSDDRRIFTLDVVETEPWGTAFEAAGYTYADLDEVYTGLTYADLEADFATYLDLAVAELE